MTGRGVSRRDLLRAVAVGAAAGVRPAVAAEPSAPAKVSKAKAQYQDGPKDVRSCATCTLFVRPDACKAVLGKVSPDGWCNLYDFSD